MNESKRALASLLAAVVVVSVGCNESPLKPKPDAGPIAGLSGEQASRVLARVGDRTVTLGDFARALEKMDPVTRARYQSKERRRELLNELVDVELLAAEARKRGIDKEPQTQESVRQVLRDAMLLRAHEGVPAPAEIQAAEVRAYYDAHTDKFTEQERRRVAAIVVEDKATAEKVLKEAQKVETQEAWSVLFAKRSVTAPKGNSSAVDLVGDLGIVGPPDDPKGGALRVPDAVRAAAFRIPKLGGIGEEPVEVGSRWFVIRINGLTPAHKRSIEEADRAIRVLLIQEKLAERDRALEADLRKKFPVQIDDAALRRVALPAGSESAEPKAP